MQGYSLPHIQFLEASVSQDNLAKNIPNDTNVSKMSTIKSKMKGGQPGWIVDIALCIKWDAIRDIELFSKSPV